MKSDFDFNTNAQTGFEYIYHTSKHLLVTIHGSGCYYTYINPQYYDSLIRNFRNEFQGLLTATVLEGRSQHVQQTTLEEVSAQFGDTQVDHNCHDKDIFLVQPDLLQCNFDSSSRPLCNWHTESPGELQWEVGQGQTPTILTGPETDHTTLTSAGKYLFIEANNGVKGDYAELVSPLTDAGSGLCLKFWYNMFGTDTGSLDVVIKNGTLTSRAININLLHEAGDKGRGWNLAEVTLPANSSLKAVRFHIRATRGNNIHGDIAIDDISSTTGICGPSLLNCTFETEPRLCHWRQTTVFDQLDWAVATRRNDTTSGAGPKLGGWQGTDYLLLDGPHGHPGDTAELQSPVVEREEPLCFQFHYFMNGTGVGELDVILLDRTTDTETTLWSRTAADGLTGTWQTARVTVVPPGPFQLFVRATRGSSVLSDIAVDDVGATAGMCHAEAPIVVG